MSMFYVYTPAFDRPVGMFSSLADAKDYCENDLDGWCVVSFFISDSEYHVWTGEALTDDEVRTVKGYMRQS